MELVADSLTWPLIAEMSEIQSTNPPAARKNCLFTPASNELVGRARTGDEKAREELIQAYQKRMAGYVFSLTGDASEVDDLCQAIFIKMLRYLSSLRDDARFEPWLFRLARNTCLDHLRRRRLRNLFTPLLSLHEEFSAPDSRPLAAELAMVNEAMQSLPLRYREVLAVCAEDRTYEEMAALLGLSMSNLKIRLHRARQALKERIKYVRNR